MSNSMYLSTENIKQMITQYKEGKQRHILAVYQPKNQHDTLVLVSELSAAHGTNGYKLYWANKDSITDDEVAQMQKALEELGLPF